MLTRAFERNGGTREGRRPETIHTQKSAGGGTIMVAIHSKHRNCTQHREERTRTSTSAGTTRASFVSGSSLRAENATSSLSTRNERFAPERMTPRIGWVHALYFTDP